jgi:hypothetical protein
VEQNRSLGHCETIPPAIQNWLSIAGLSAVVGNPELGA